MNNSNKRSPGPKPKPKQTQHRQRPNPEFSTGERQGERIQKVLARGGVGSRREIEDWIRAGKLLLNNKKAALGDRLTVGDVLKINGRVIHWDKYAQQQTRVLIYNKPTGEIVSRHDPEGRPVIFNRLPKLSIGRWIAIGRLDINTQGLLLLTNNGELANRMMHPSSQIDREYAVRTLGTVSDQTLERMKQGVQLEDGMANFADIKFHGGEGANKWYYVTVTEGRNRLVRRLWESQGIQVSRLMRVRYGPVLIPEGLKTHQYHELENRELKALFRFIGFRDSLTKE